jgi:hypothetical protein
MHAIQTTAMFWGVDGLSLLSPMFLSYQVIIWWDFDDTWCALGQLYWFYLTENKTKFESGNSDTMTIWLGGNVLWHVIIQYMLQYSIIAIITIHMTVNKLMVAIGNVFELFWESLLST